MQVTNGASARSVALRAVGPDQFFGTGQIDGTGALRVTAIVPRSGERLSVILPWRATNAEPVPPGGQGRRLAPIVDVLAVLVLLATAVTAAVGAGAAARHTRPTGPISRSSPLS